MNAKHTPGPWELGTHPANHKLNIIKPVLFGSRVTVLPECEGGHVSIKNIADARLIAAAPYLFEIVLEVAADGLHPEDERGECLCSHCERTRKARAAIALARGE